MFPDFPDLSSTEDFYDWFDRLLLASGFANVPELQDAIIAATRAQTYTVGELTARLEQAQAAVQGADFSYLSSQIPSIRSSLELQVTQFGFPPELQAQLVDEVVGLLEQIADNDVSFIVSAFDDVLALLDGIDPSTNLFDAVLDLAGGVTGDPVDIDGTNLADILRGGSGAEYFDGFDGNDLIQAGNGDDTARGWGDDDEIYMGLGIDRAHGGDGRDLIYGGGGSDSLTGDNGYDTIHGGAGADDLFGGMGQDVMFGGKNDDWLMGEIGFDRLHGNKGNDLVVGGKGYDTLFGGEGDDSVRGDEGNNFVYGGPGQDYVDANTGDDVLFGGSGDDTISAQGGDDTIRGGFGSDVMYGGAGADIFVWAQGNAGDHDTINTFAATEDVLRLGSVSGMGGLELEAITLLNTPSTRVHYDGQTIDLLNATPEQLTEANFEFF